MTATEQNPQDRIIRGLHKIYEQQTNSYKALLELQRSVDQLCLLMMHLIGRGEHRPVPKDILQSTELEVITRLGLDEHISAKADAEEPKDDENPTD